MKVGYAYQTDLKSCRSLDYELTRAQISEKIDAGEVFINGIGWCWLSTVVRSKSYLTWISIQHFVEG